MENGRPWLSCILYNRLKILRVWCVLQVVIQYICLAMCFLLVASNFESVAVSPCLDIQVTTKLVGGTTLGLIFSVVPSI
jgi:hypothetical protein